MLRNLRTLVKNAKSLQRLPGAWNYGFQTSQMLNKKLAIGEASVVIAEKIKNISQLVTK